MKSKSNLSPKMAFTLVVAFLLVPLVLCCQYFINPIDVITGQHRLVASQTLPDGGRIEIVQYWNHGDFYNLDLLHFGRDGSRYECVIDPDCPRMPSASIKMDITEGKATIKASFGIWARYKWSTKELLRQNGLLIVPEPRG